MTEEDAKLEDYSIMTLTAENIESLGEVAIGDVFGFVVCAVDENEVRFTLKKI